MQSKLFHIVKVTQNKKILQIITLEVVFEGFYILMIKIKELEDSLVSLPPPLAHFLGLFVQVVDSNLLWN